MDNVLQPLANLFTLAFVVTSMLSMGLGLTVQQIVSPLRNGRLVALALVANFVVVPLAALLITQIIPLSEPLRIGILLLSTAAGAPFLPKLAQVAKGNVPFAVGLMTLLMVVTVGYLPIVLPLLLPGVAVDAGQIARSLLIQMPLPLGLGLLVKARYSEFAAHLLPPIGQASSISLIFVFVLMVALNFDNMIGLFGSGGLLAVLLLTLLSLTVGYGLGTSADTRRVLGLGTGQRNLAAAFVVATGNFAAQPEVSVLLAAAGLVMLATLMPVAGEFGKRTRPSPSAGSTTEF